MAGFGERAFGSLSSGERQRVLLARALMADAPLIVLDEPSAGLDLGGREDLLGRLDRLGSNPEGPAQVLITHHPEEIPPSFTHVLLIRNGMVGDAGPIDEVLTAESLSDTFGLPLNLSGATADLPPGRRPSRTCTASVPCPYGHQDNHQFR